MPTFNHVPAFSARNKSIGSLGLTTDVNADSGQIAALTAFINRLGLGNAAKSAVKVVRLFADIANLDPLSCCLETVCFVVDPVPGAPSSYRLKYTEYRQGVTLKVCRDGKFDEYDTSDALWYDATSPFAGIRAFSEDTAGYVYAAGDLRRGYVSGAVQEQIFKRTAPGPAAPPTGVAGNANWEHVNEADAPRPVITRDEFYALELRMNEVESDLVFLEQEVTDLQGELTNKADLNPTTRLLQAAQLPIATATTLGAVKARRGLIVQTASGFLDSTAVDYVGETTYVFDADFPLRALSVGLAYALNGADASLPALTASSAAGRLIAVRNIGTTPVQLFASDAATLLYTLAPGEYLWLKYVSTGYQVVLRGRADGAGSTADRCDLATFSGLRTNTVVCEGQVTVSSPVVGPSVASFSAQVIIASQPLAAAAPVRTGTAAAICAALTADVAALTAPQKALYYLRFITVPTTSSEEAHILLTLTAQ